MKTSSLGDVVHTLPALTDATQAIPGVRFDWVVEEGFREVPGWHPAVNEIIPVAWRRWRKNILKAWRSGEWRAFKKTMQAQPYDLVIDAQGLLKSAWLTRYAEATTCGLDRQSAREPIASRFYDVAISVAKGQHAVERTRQLFAQALGYTLPEEKGCYAIDVGQDIDWSGKVKPAGDYLVFLHGTTRDNKHWPEPYWIELAKQVAASGCAVYLPWGNNVEQARAERICNQVPQAHVLPRLSLAELAAVIRMARAVVAVDTGLGHLTAALDVPAVSLYGPTSPDLVGTYGRHQVHLQAKDYPPHAVDVEPEVFRPLTPEHVIDQLNILLESHR